MKIDSVKLYCLSRVVRLLLLSSWLDDVCQLKFSRIIFIQTSFALFFLSQNMRLVMFCASINQNLEINCFGNLFCTLIVLSVVFSIKLWWNIEIVFFITFIVVSKIILYSIKKQRLCIFYIRSFEQNCFVQ